MGYLYHLVPLNMKGETLYPLNELKDIYPEIYAHAVKKYKEREELMKQTVPVLHHLWNDFLHMAAVDPREIKTALLELNYERGAMLKSFYKIDPHLLEGDRTIIYLNKHKNIDEKWKESNFAQFDPNKVEEYSVLPEETKIYFKTEIEAGRDPLIYHRVPHFLYNGTLDTTKLERIEI